MENIVVKEIIPNEDKRIIKIKLENGDIIKAFKTYSTHFQNEFTYNTYTLGGVFKQTTIQELRTKLLNNGIICNTLEDCLGKNRIDSAIEAIEGVSIEEYAEKIRKNAKTYTYKELESITNTELQKEYGQTKGLVTFFNNMSQGAGQSIPSKK